MIQKHHIVPTIINFVTGMSFAPAKILSSELMPPNSKKDNAVKIETREKPAEPDPGPPSIPGLVCPGQQL